VNITPDTVIMFRIAGFPVNATLFYTWVIMAALTALSLIATNNVSVGSRMSRLQNALEVIIGYIRKELAEITEDRPAKYLPLLGALYLFIAVSNFCAIIPGYYPPTGSLNTTAALALCVFVAVPAYGISQAGLGAYLRHYIEPVPYILPFNLIGEFSRTLALAVRLFGNVMSGALLTGVLVSVTPLFVPVLMNAFSLLIGQIHAYIFVVLSAVYIASGARAQSERLSKNARRDAAESMA
jgi:F-type H+-transporting ATPase subunit a